MIIQYKGLPLHYDRIGEGKPLIFLHGFNENSKIWDWVIPTIQKDFTCITIDLPGFGRSPLPGNLTLDYMANAVYRLIEELNLLNPVIIGHSMGGYVCLEIGIKHENKLGGIALFHSTAVPDSEQKIENRLKTLAFLNSNPIEAYYKIFLSGLFSQINLKNEVYQTAEKIIIQTKIESIIAGTKAMIERKGRLDLLTNSNLPWLLIAGKNDQLIPIESLSLQASFCKKAMFEILSESAHAGMLEEPEKSSKIIMNFAKWVFDN